MLRSNNLQPTETLASDLLIISACTTTAHPGLTYRTAIPLSISSHCSSAYLDATSQTATAFGNAACDLSPKSASSRTWHASHLADVRHFRRRFMLQFIVLIALAREK